MMSKSKFMNILKKTAQWLIGIGLLGFIISQLSLDTLLRDIVDLSWVFLTLAFLIMLGTRILCAYKWYILARINHQSLTFRKLLAINFFSGAVGTVVPFINSDLVAGYTYYRLFGKASNSISSILVDRVIGLYVTILTAVVGVLISIGLFMEIQSVLFLTGGILLATIIVTCIMVYLLLHPKYKLPDWLPSRLKRLLNETLGVIKGYIKQHRSKLLINACLCIVVQVMRILSTYALILAIHSQVSILYFISIVPLIFLFAQLPISVSGLGIQEGAFIFFLGLVGVTAESAFAISVIGRAIRLITAIPGAIWVIYWLKVNNKNRIEDEAIIRSE